MTPERLGRETYGRTYEVSTSPTAGAPGLAQLTAPLVLGPLALYAAYREGVLWYWLAAAGLLAWGAFEVFRELQRRRREPSALVLALDHLVIPLWSGGRWREREIPFARVSQILNTGGGIVLFEPSGKGGVQPLGAVLWADLELDEPTRAAVEISIRARVGATVHGWSHEVLAAVEANATEAPDAFGVAVREDDDGFHATHVVEGPNDWAALLEEGYDGRLHTFDERGAAFRAALAEPFGTSQS